MTNIGIRDCSDEAVERALLVDDDNRNCFEAYAHDSEGLKYEGAETKQRRREENMFGSSGAVSEDSLERARDDMFSIRVGLERSLLAKIQVCFK